LSIVDWQGVLWTGEWLGDRGLVLKVWLMAMVPCQRLVGSSGAVTWMAMWPVMAPSGCRWRCPGCLGRHPGWSCMSCVAAR